MPRRVDELNYDGEFLQVSIISATSYESRCGAQVFAQTGQYRNVMVRIKELKFNKKRDVSRESMKEMRILRDLRHDNVNSFIGAAIDMTRILVVTDYCAKGSLYVSVMGNDGGEVFKAACVILTEFPPFGVVGYRGK